MMVVLAHWALLAMLLVSFFVSPWGYTLAALRSFNQDKWNRAHELKTHTNTAVIGHAS